MAAKKTLVELECHALHSTMLLEITHAERLLRMRNNGGWVLPDKSPYIFENGTISKRNSKATQRQ